MTDDATAPPPSILLAEDDQIMSEVIQLNLRRSGFLVTAARNGLEAWGLIQAQHFDLLITDYQMPLMDGAELCRAIRSQLPNSQIPIICLSARGLELDVPKMKEELKIEALLFKPLSPRELVALAKTCISAKLPQVVQ